LRHWATLVPLAAAATLAVVLLGPRLTARRSVASLDLAALVVGGSAASGSLGSRLGEGWGEPGWSVVRGDDAQAAEPKLAFRLGVMLAGMRLAIDGQDANAAMDAGRDLASQLRDIFGGGPLAQRFDNLVTRLRDSAPTSGTRDELDALSTETARLSASPVWLELGAWTGIARVASLARNRSFFEPRSEAAKQLDRLVDAVDETSVEAGETYRSNVAAALRSLQSATNDVAQDDARISEAIASLIMAAAG